MAVRREFLCLEPSYEGNPIQGLQDELNALGAEGWRFAGLVPVREIDGGRVSTETVPAVVLTRDGDGEAG
jgi:hypothetical protein